MFRKLGIKGWRRHQSMFGNPDFVFAQAKIAVFVDGCFWHGCPNHCRMPKTNREYWENKIEKNKRRDRKVTRVLRSEDWNVIRIWEHELDEVGVKRKLRILRKAIYSAGLAS